jgi:hypothetical protein
MFDIEEILRVRSDYMNGHETTLPQPPLFNQEMIRYPA